MYVVIISLLFFSHFLYFCSADIYLQNPRGSNNRYNGEKRDVDSVKRLFDSQNNRRGGYNVGNVYYTAGSKLSLEWTNDNGCGGGTTNCDIIIQYMCGNNVRDGSSNKAIPSENRECKNEDCETDRNYGMHESYLYYKNCTIRKANTGVYVPEKVKPTTASRTRQNTRGTKYGFECAEERDYYPYWQPTPWRDIAVLTSRPGLCDTIIKESENVKGRWYCKAPPNFDYIPIDKESCLKMKTQNGNSTLTGQWLLSDSHKLPSPTCQEPDPTPANHLGNTASGHPPSFNWTVPAQLADNCVMRIRLNVSSPISDNISDTWRQAGLKTVNDGTSRGFLLAENPSVEVFPGLSKLKLKLAVFPNKEMSRVYQDRSHVFAIRPRPSSIPAASVVHNINVRGKRGNIVQVFPAVEYDYVPNTVDLARNDFVHFQWTGSNANPQNNDGEGRAGTDRSNLVIQGPRVYTKAALPDNITGSGTHLTGQWGRSYPRTFPSSLLNLGGLDKKSMRALAYLTSVQMMGDMDLLNDAGTYFDLGPRKITSNGAYHFMCTRNNNFSNRSQKGRLLCSNSVPEYFSIGVRGGSIEARNQGATLTIPPNAVNRLVHFKLEVNNEELVESPKITSYATAMQPPPGHGYATPTVKVGSGANYTHPLSLRIRVSKNLPDNAAHFDVYRSSGLTWELIPSSLEDGTSGENYLSLSIKQDGVYVGRYEKTSVAAIIGGVIAGLIILGLLFAGVFVYFRRNPETWRRIRSAHSRQI